MLVTDLLRDRFRFLPKRDRLVGATALAQEVRRAEQALAPFGALEEALVVQGAHLQRERTVAPVFPRACAFGADSLTGPGAVKGRPTAETGSALAD